MSEPGFVVGGTYENAAGAYGVLSIDGNMVRVRYGSGFEMTLPAQGLWAQWEAIVRERTGRTEEPRAATSTTTAARTRTERAPAAPRTTSATTTKTPKAPKMKKASSPEAMWMFTAGYLAAGCDINASVAGRDYVSFAQRYQLWTGRSLVTPRPGLDVHERPGYSMSAELSVRFKADAHALSLLDFGKDVKPQRTESGRYEVRSRDVVERLLRFGFDLGPNNDPAPLREKTSGALRDEFDRGVTVRRMVRA